MNLLVSLLLLVALFVIGAGADPSGPEYPSPDYTSVKPSLAVVIGILSVMFALTFFLLVYAKFCHQPARPARLDWPAGHSRTPEIGSSGRFSGIDKTVIESLPFFQFSSLQGSRAGLECSVCLSKFEDVEILRLLPKCRHAFHIDCIDHWLEKHSSCPLCRSRVGSNDVALVALSNSLRFLNPPPEPEPGPELFIQREESRRRGSSRFCSFRNPVAGDEMRIQINPSESVEQSGDLHKYNHRINFAPDFALRSRWSNVNSSDLITLSSEMLIDTASARFFQTEAAPAPGRKTGESNESKSGPIPIGSKSVANSSGEQRSVSEITGLSRFRNAEPRSLPGSEEGLREERVRRVWLAIARRTVQWFANRERRSLQFEQNQERQSLDV